MSLFNIEWSIPKFEIGYWLRTTLIGKGYMTEAVVALTKMAKETLKANRIEIRCDERNVRSRRVAERAGYRLEGILAMTRTHHPARFAIPASMPSFWTASCHASASFTFSFRLKTSRNMSIFDRAPQISSSASPRAFTVSSTFLSVTSLFTDDDNRAVAAIQSIGHAQQGGADANDAAGLRR